MRGHIFNEMRSAHIQNTFQFSGSPFYLAPIRQCTTPGTSWTPWPWKLSSKGAITRAPNYFDQKTFAMQRRKDPVVTRPGHKDKSRKLWPFHFFLLFFWRCPTLQKRYICWRSTAELCFFRAGFEPHGCKFDKRQKLGFWVWFLCF